MPAGRRLRLCCAFGLTNLAPAGQYRQETGHNVALAYLLPLVGAGLLFGTGLVILPGPSVRPL